MNRQPFQTVLHACNCQPFFCRAQKSCLSHTCTANSLHAAVHVGQGGELCHEPAPNFSLQQEFGQAPFSLHYFLPPSEFSPSQPCKSHKWPDMNILHPGLHLRPNSAFTAAGTSSFHTAGQVPQRPLTGCLGEMLLLWSHLTFLSPTSGEGQPILPHAGQTCQSSLSREMPAHHMSEPPRLSFHKSSTPPISRKTEQPQVQKAGTRKVLSLAANRNNFC